MRLNLNNNLNSIQMFTTHKANATETQSQQGVGVVAGGA